MLLNMKSLHLVKSYACEQWRGNVYSAFKSRRIILLEQGMTCEQGSGGELWLEHSLVPGGSTYVSNFCFLK